MKPDTLQKLWPERADESLTLDYLLGVPRVPKWDRLVIEREEMLAGRFRDQARELSEKWDINRPEHFLALDSVHKYVRNAVALMSASGEVPEWATPLRVPDKNGTIHTADIPLDRMRQTELHLVYSLRRWEHFRKRVFLVDPETWGLLCRTDLPAMPASELKHPFPSFYLKFPPGFWEFDIGKGLDGRSNLQPIEGAMVNLVAPSGGNPAELVVLVTGRSSKGTGDDNMVFLHWYLDDSELSAFKMKGIEEALPVGGEHIGVTLPHALFNFLLYLMSEQPHLEPVPPPVRIRTGNIKSAAKLRKLERRANKQSSLGYLWVGPPPAKNESEISEEGRKLDHLVYVRGHWRWQAFGMGRQERKLLWIRPHLRGPDAIEAASVVRKQRIQPARHKT